MNKQDIDDLIWVEKYRPQEISDLILDSSIRSIFEKAITDNEIPNLLLTGSPGVGKTSLIKLLCNKLDRDFLFINAPLEANIDLLRDQIANFARTMSLKDGHKVIILDECDNVKSQNFFPALQPMIEKFDKNARFCLTGNYHENFPAPIKSRLQHFHFSITNKKEYAGSMMKRLEYILTTEGVAYDKKILSEIIISNFPDIRKVIQVCQQYKDKLTSEDMKYYMKGSNVEKLVLAMKGKDFKGIEEFIIKEFSNEDSIYRQIYEKLKDFLIPQSIPVAILIMADYMRHHSHVADKQIYVIAFCLELAKSCDFRS